MTWIFRIGLLLCDLVPSPNSPSSLLSLELCPRKYAWRWVDHIQGEGSYYTRFGTRVHKILEDYYKIGLMPDLNEPEGNCAVALLAHLPPPQPGLRIEERRFVGRFEGSPDLTLGARVWDHKTTSDHKWAKRELNHDLQASLYAWFVMQETGESRITLQWNYVTREKRPRVLPIIQQVTQADIQHTLDRANRLADQADYILSHRIGALDLPPNLSACDMFGGCQHRERCNLSSGARMASLLEQHDMTTADFMAKMNATHPPTPGAPPPPPAAQVSPDGKWRLEGNEWVPNAPPPPPPTSVPINPPPPPTQAAPPPPPPWTPPAQAVPPPPSGPIPGVDEPVSPHEVIAQALEDLAHGVRMLVGASASKRGPGRPRKSKPEM